MRPLAILQKNTLQRRLSLVFAGAATLLWLLATLAAGFVLRAEIDTVFDSALQEVAQRVLPLAYLEILDRDGTILETGGAAEVPSVAPHREYITYIIRDAQGRVLMQSHDAEPAGFPAVLEPGFHAVAGRRFFTESAVRGTVSVTTTERSGHRHSAVMKAIATLILPLAMLLPLSLVGVWRLIALTFQPVARFQKEIEARDPNNLTPLETGKLPGEIMPVADAVNALIARLRRAMVAERGFASNSAHELRTPVAAALAQTQRLIAELPEGALRARGRAIETALRRLSRLSEKLLQWAKAEGGTVIAEQPEDGVDVLLHVIEALGADEDNGRRLRLTLPSSGHCDITLESDAFAVLARNLIENALKHGSEDQPVWVHLSDAGLFCVRNPGAVVPAEELLRLLAPFERGATRAEGAGLGLAIVQGIARGAGSALILSSPATGMEDGFEARVQLPRAG